MPLSDREQQILDEIEKNLYDEDPQFARGVRRSSPHASEYRNLRLGLGAFLAGLALLVAFFLTSAVLVGVGAFAAMVAGIVLVAGALHTLVKARADRASASAVQARLVGLVQRWDQQLRDRYKRR